MRRTALEHHLVLSGATRRPSCCPKAEGLFTRAPSAGRRGRGPPASRKLPRFPAVSEAAGGSRPSRARARSGIERLNRQALDARAPDEVRTALHGSHCTLAGRRLPSYPTRTARLAGATTLRSFAGAAARLALGQ